MFLVCEPFLSRSERVSITVYSSHTVPCVFPQFPDYYQVIKNPINLGIIKDKVRSLCYESVVDFVFDMRQMFDNCRIYNDVSCSCQITFLFLPDILTRIT